MDFYFSCMFIELKQKTVYNICQEFNGLTNADKPNTK